MKEASSSVVQEVRRSPRGKGEKPAVQRRSAIERVWDFLTSLRLTVVCLGFGIVLVFLGTLAQVNEGLWNAQERWFRSFFIWWRPTASGPSFPILPGGYLVGVVLLANLIAAHIKRFQVTSRKLGIHLTHLGIVLLLVGQLVTDMLSQESHLSLREGETRNYSESHRDHELVFVTDADSEREEVVAIPESVVAAKRDINHEKLPFTVRVKQYGINSQVRQRAPMMDHGDPPATEGFGRQATVIPLPETREMNKNNLPYAVLELLRGSESLGTWLVSPWLEEQQINVQGRTWRAAFRPERFYTPFSVKLLKTTHEVYRGTEIPKNFQSRVRLENPAKGESREVDIYMNNPLRYEGLTFYQYQMGRDERNASVGTSTLQVVRNPGWLTPYLGCIIVALGMAYQFLFHLVRFITKRKSA